MTGITSMPSRISGWKAKRVTALTGSRPIMLTAKPKAPASEPLQNVVARDADDGAHTEEVERDHLRGEEDVRQARQRYDHREEEEDADELAEDRRQSTSHRAPDRSCPACAARNHRSP